MFVTSAAALVLSPPAAGPGPGLGSGAGAGKRGQKVTKGTKGKKGTQFNVLVFLIDSAGVWYKVCGVVYGDREIQRRVCYKNEWGGSV